MMKRLPRSLRLQKVLQGTILSAVVVGMGLGSVNAQPSSRQGRGGLSGFDSKSPDVGETIPQVNAYTPDGEKFSLRELKGEYTVLVFGCLT